MMDRIKFRRKTAADWAAVNAIPPRAEAVYESDTGRWKIGDGVTAWADLQYQPSPADVTTVTAVGPGIDTTGATSSQTALQALVNSLDPGSVLEFPSTAVYSLTDTITVGVANVTIRGAGELRWTSGITNKPGLSVTAPGVCLDGLHLTNPNELRASTGNRNLGISIAAHESVVKNCLIEKFQGGVLVGAAGEWLHTRIINNRIIDVTGAGSGSASDDGYGEDRGDGITVWGAKSVISGNTVTAKAGADARVGIHVEGLPTYEVTGDENADAMHVISGNVVSGPFRRGITSEDTFNPAITGNTISGATWYSIHLVGGAVYTAVGATVSGNTIRWTRTTADVQGASWAPKRCAFMLYRGVYGASVTGNTVHVQATANLPYVAVLDTEAGGVVTDTVLSNNTVHIEAGGVVTKGISMAGAAGCIIQGNRIELTAGAASDAAINSANSSNCLISGNRLSGANTGRGIAHDGANGISIVGNHVDYFATGLYFVNSTSGGSLVGNSIINCSVGVDLFGTTGRTKLDNRFVAVTTEYTNVSYTALQSWAQTRNAGTSTPTGGKSGDLLLGTSKIWANDAGTWRNATLVTGRVVTDAATITDADQWVVFNSASPISQALPAATAVTPFKEFCFLNIGSGVVTFTDTISGTANRTLANLARLRVMSTGSTWFLTT